MKLPKKIFETIASNFFFYFKEDGDARNQAISILKIYNIRLDNEGNLVHRDFSYSSSKPKPFFSPLPFNNLERLDIESFETVLNNYPQTACLMSPLFDCIGWVISNSSGIWRLLFLGSSTYDLWKQIYFNPEEDVKWYEGLDEYDINWRKGKGWIDGIDVEELRSKNQVAWKIEK